MRKLSPWWTFDRKSLSAYQCIRRDEQQGRKCLPAGKRRDLPLIHPRGRGYGDMLPDVKHSSPTMFNVRTLTYKLELMDTLAHQLEKADRLAAVTQSVGFALWQLQELEGASAEYFVLLTQAKQGMGLEAGNALVEKAQAKTFGATLRQIAKAGLIPTEIESRFTKLLSERNWLVHRSRLDSRNVIYRAHAMRDLIARLEVIADEALALLKYIGAEITAFTQKHGVSPQYVEEMSKQMLEQWQAADAL
ncbi:MAG: hypothetical protein AW11_00746 [Candidatus Accumulibacter regalis]|uniref:Uncharacterized protein n=2 Tax=Candidatus Accumulibacter TaxID=327159 RepID=A0A011QMK8_ACCRE|nr:MAG: hypothetical protein AW11_00746 [Candidatus Accumulibacter regalis]